MILTCGQWLSTKLRPGSTVIAYDRQGTYTLENLREAAGRIAFTLRGLQVKRAALCLENSYLFSAALLGCLYSGCVPLLPGHNRAEQLRSQHHLFDMVLSDRHLAGLERLQLGSDAQGAFELTHFAAQEPQTAPGKAVCPLDAAQVTSQVDRPLGDDACLILFTSGSTGTPKQVPKPISALDEEARLTAQVFGERLKGCRLLSSVYPMHMFGLTFRIFMPLAQGLCMYAGFVHYTEELLSLCRDRSHPGGLAFISSPAFLRRLDITEHGPEFKLTLSAGGALPYETALVYHEWCGSYPEEIYGSTETGIIAHRVNDAPQALWQPFAGMRFTQSEDETTLHSPLLGSPFVLDDRLEIGPGGITLLGRRDRIVKIEDKRVAPAEVERRLKELPQICEAAVLPREVAGRLSLSAVVVLSEGAREQLSRGQLILQLRAALRPKLEPLAIPRYWRFVDELPLNSMGKRDRAVLLSLFERTPES